MEIVVKNVNKWYGTRPVLKDISLTLNTGITGLLGPNGAGKTTLISIIAGLMRPSAGRVEINGKSPYYNHSVRKYIGLLPENAHLPKRFSIREFLTWQAITLKAEQKEVDKVLDIVGMTRYHKETIGSLSKGMKQRIKFAAAILGDPPILLLDEPFSGIDPHGRKILRNLILSYAKEKTIVFSSHILEEVQMIAHNIVVLKTGYIVAEGTPEGIRKLLTDVPYKVYIETSDPIKLINTLFERKLIHMGKIESPDGITVETFSFSELSTAIPQIAVQDNISIKMFSPEDVKLEKLFEYLTMRGDLT
ncbi:ATP-binding cassette domain-containing protein [bacterium 3DAC]|nr:ATP-binding cassette domain-containing protein [bacterium 3DAC]